MNNIFIEVHPEDEGGSPVLIPVDSISMIRPYPNAAGSKSMIELKGDWRKPIVSESFDELKALVVVAEEGGSAE